VFANQALFEIGVDVSLKASETRLPVE
jgi:hypothetical protein